ncbi:helix-turn-helix domain-containing protein [Novilysobacter erysipheiresistens]|uniref:Helix-turn-helix domain-containing protein n=1 Tax=Novilysobacter erysipheiresistens TaxID=1749332 RepID=A0ABU7YZG6_9GAMM
MDKTLWADRGQLLQLDAPETGGPSTLASAGCIAVSRLGSVQLSAQVFTVWVQLRGSSWVEAREGKFRLRRGDWMALERDSRPQVQADRHGLCIGLSLDADALKAAARLADLNLHAGRGTLDRRDTRIMLRLWRGAARRLATLNGADGVAEVTALRPLLLQLAAIQSDLSARVARCPGRSRLRKRQVFSRLQRARLYLEGNCDRVVRISELAELTSFSSWYFSKTFHSVYDESPQAASARMRLERAADLLDNSEMMIGEVAAASGFDNCCSFARAFRVRYGMSATGYRNAARKRALAPAATSLRSANTRSRPDSAKPAGFDRKAA